MDRHIQHSVFHTIAFLAFSCLAISTLASWCRKFMSRIFHPCNMVPHFHVPQIHVSHFQRPRRNILQPRDLACGQWRNYTHRQLRQCRGQGPKTVKGAQSDPNYVSRLLLDCVANVCRGGGKNYSYATGCGTLFQSSRVILTSPTDCLDDR